MKFLLDKFTPAAAFWPHTATELFALRLAQKLDDVPSVRHYVTLAESYSESQMLNAYRRTLRCANNADLGRQFQSEIVRAAPNGRDRDTKLISIRVERRTVAACIFNGHSIEYADSRQLSSDNSKALDSAISFMTWILNRFPVESGAIEEIPNGHQFQRHVLHDAICDELRIRLLPIWQIPKLALLEGCGHPPLKSRGELRKVVTSIWPVLEGSHAKLLIQDAASLGLHVQTERLFIIN
jgi:hypothetical protein